MANDPYFIEPTETERELTAWKRSLEQAAAKAKDGAEFKKMIEAQENILASDPSGMVIYSGKKIGTAETPFIFFDAKLADRSEIDFKKFVSSIDPKTLPSPLEAQQRLAAAKAADDAREYQDRVAKEYETLAKERLVWSPRQLQDSPFAMALGKSPQDLALRLLQENRPDSPALPALAHEAEYKKLMQALKERHEQEREQLVQKQNQLQQAKIAAPMNEFGDLLLRHVKEREQLYKRYDADIDRYTRDYEAAKVIRDVLQLNDLRREIEKGRTR